MVNEMPDSDKRKILEYLGKCYRRGKMIMDVSNFSSRTAENSALYNANLNYVYLIDRALSECSANTRNIIRHDYLTNSDPDWYKEYYSESMFYRYKKSAVSEFLEKLNI